MFKYRLLTVIILLPIVLLIIWFLPMPWFSIFIGIVTVWAGWEWSGLMRFSSKTGCIIYVGLLMLAMVVAYFLATVWVLFVALLAWLWAGLAVFRYSQNRPPMGLQMLFLKGLMGLLTLAPCWIAIDIVRLIGGPFWLFFGLLLIWSMDTGAYIAGRLWGKHKLIPRVSPKKTWEGLCGGMVLTIVVAVFVSLLHNASGYRTFLIAILAFVIALFSVLGDLFESLLKREAGVKDSGSVLPGHGGILDRIDSITAGFPIFALGLLLFHGYVV